jgi:signal transduction histidine kinase
MTDDLLLSKKSFTRIAVIQSALLITFLGVTAFAVRREVRQVYNETLITQLGDSVELLAKQWPMKVDAQWCAQAADQTALRISVIDAKSGAIVCDNGYPLDQLPSSLLDRAEIIDALQSSNHRGRSVRASVLTRNLDRVYFTVYSPERGLVLRGGLPLNKIQDALRAVDWLFAAGSLLLSIGLAIILIFSARRIGYASAARAVDRSRKQMQDDFIANVSHEFRTPLTSIRGFASTIRGDLTAQRPIEPEFVEIIVRDADRMLSMVDEMLELMTLDSGTVRLEIETTDVREITEEVIKRLQVVHAAKGSRVEAIYEVETVEADPNRLIQILTNLIGNALNHNPSGTQVRVKWSSDPAGAVTLVVEDNGHGIPLAAQSRVFDRFVRVNENGVKSRGTGLGLPIVKELVKAHGGDICLESAPGQGTRFIVGFSTLHKSTVSGS